MREIDGDAILRNRSAAYRAGFPFARRTDVDEIWFLSPRACQAVLTRAEFSSERSRIPNWLRARGELRLAEFFSRWLMYTDGPVHRRRRNAVTSALRRVSSTRPQFQRVEWIGRLPECFELVSEFAAPLVWAIVPQALGVPEWAIPIWSEHVPVLTALPGLLEPDVDSIQQARESHQKLVESVRNGAAGPLFVLISDQLAHDEDTDAIVDIAINVIGDGVHPVVAALSAEIWLRTSSGSRLAPTSGASCKFHSEAPFQYVARTATEALTEQGIRIEPGQRVVACIGFVDQANAASVSLSFGYGRHGCPGRSIAERAIVFACQQFFDAFPNGCEAIGEPRWLPSIGYRAIEHLILRKRGP